MSGDRVVRKNAAAPIAAPAAGVPSKGTIYYEGTWQSGGFPWLIAHGTVLAEVNYDKKEANILLRYDGVWNKGVTTRIETKVEPGTDPLKYVFRARVDSDTKQSLEFTATSITSAEIKGTYKSRSPRDSGPFQIKASSKERFQQFAQEAGACTIQ